MVDNARSQFFILEFDKNKSSFKKIAKLDLLSDREKIVDKIASGFLTTSNNCFIDQNAKNYILQTDEGILIRRPFKALDWNVLRK